MVYATKSTETSSIYERHAPASRSTPAALFAVIFPFALTFRVVRGA